MQVVLFKVAEGIKNRQSFVQQGHPMALLQRAQPRKIMVWQPPLLLRSPSAQSPPLQAPLLPSSLSFQT